jgi:hypothetical protein
MHTKSAAPPDIQAISRALNGNTTVDIPMNNAPATKARDTEKIKGLNLLIPGCGFVADIRDCGVAFQFDDHVTQTPSS